MGRPTEIQQRLSDSRRELEQRGLPPEAIRVVQRHPDALEAVEAALDGRELEAPRVAYGPRRGLRDGYAAERDRDLIAVVRYEPAGEWAGAPFGEEKTVIWTTQ